jgi:hypothetical protein
MLFDPKWQTETKPTFHGFVAWLGTQPPEKTYNWGDPCNCAIAQYLATMGRRVSDLGYREYSELEGRRSGGELVGVACHAPHTMGAALGRARALLR